jgi:cell shape-determining protein MreC
VATARIHPAWLLPLLLIACVSQDAERERERVELADRIVELEQENMRLQARIEALESLLPAISGGQVTRLPTEPPIDARVLAHQPDRNRVLLDKGARDGVALGFVFDVYSGKVYKGQVRVTEVDDSTSFAEIRTQKNPFAPGDSATTQL